ncbi:YqeY-like protein [Leptospira broomii serovar Hurstbridge str. 5399]|uniref:YqeY-like protein n=1 Tax=Leptospira broomii serovar Hurstbridge str. 5399 TaxID=1049789 RepID=T0F5R1_9LEPT|nr:GatB/YqeY domain-containing protein [Leptospira broomii]EQA43261.1 YqeY-like protein [Leptospira broomii serovar Hurstbridge str. 5399]
MSLQAKINTDLKEAIKSKQEPLLSTLRLLKADIQYELTKTGAQELSDEQIIVLIKRSYVKRTDAIQMYEKANRSDLADKEKAEAEVLKSYLPPEVSEDQILGVLDKIVAELKPTGPKDIGKVMGRVMAEFKGLNIDGSKVSAIVKSKLS